MDLSKVFHEFDTLMSEFVQIYILCEKWLCAEHGEWLLSRSGGTEGPYENLNCGCQAQKDPMKIWTVVVTNGGMLHHDNIIFDYIKSHLIKL